MIHARHDIIYCETYLGKCIIHTCTWGAKLLGLELCQCMVKCFINDLLYCPVHWIRVRVRVRVRVKVRMRVRVRVQQ